MLASLKSKTPFARSAKSRRKSREDSVCNRIARIRTIGDFYQQMSAEELQEETDSLSHEAIALGSVDQPELQVRIFALVTEAVRRATALTLHDEQLHAAMIISNGSIAQMQTGEGKTLVAVAGAFAHGLLRRGVHVSTTNAYLAERDYELARTILSPLNISVGHVAADLPIDATRAAYDCDVTYGTGYQFGFDYLRDQMTLREQVERPLGSEVAASIHGNRRADDRLRQRSLAMAIVDEADSVMIDEAMVPLVLSGQPVTTETDEAFRVAHRVALLLHEQEDFSVDSNSKQIALSAQTCDKIHEEMRGTNIRQLVRPWSRYVENALYAIHNLERDVHYVVQDDEVQLVDRNTGRIFPDRTWRDGLHQAVETKEGVTIRPNDFSTTRITRQRFFQFYDRIGGLTGTAIEASGELKHFYGLDVVDVPTHEPCLRRHLPARFFTDNETKYVAIAECVQACHDRGQPVLVGTTTIQQSRELSSSLAKLSIKHVVLNGVQDESEAEIISAAGEVAAVTVATNMAGRGTDIKPSSEAIRRGGLQVVAAEYALSARTDRQLVGRAARQGDPGSCQQFLSADDELVSLHAPQLAQRIIDEADPSGEYHCDLTEAIGQLQTQIEANSFAARKQIVQSDAWFDTIRQTLH